MSFHPGGCVQATLPNMSCPGGVRDGEGQAGFMSTASDGAREADTLKK